VRQALPRQPRTVGEKVMILPTWSGTRQNNL